MPLIYSSFVIQLLSLVLQLMLQLHFTVTVKNAYAEYHTNTACNSKLAEILFSHN